MQTRLAITKQAECLLRSMFCSSLTGQKDGAEGARDHPGQLKQLTDRGLANPETVRRAEYALLIKIIGYRGTQKPLAQSRQRQQPDKKVQLKELKRTVQADEATKEQESQAAEEQEQAAAGREELAAPEKQEQAVTEKPERAVVEKVEQVSDGKQDQTVGEKSAAQQAMVLAEARQM